MAFQDSNLDIDSDIFPTSLPDIFFEILPVIHSGILSSIYSGILSVIYSKGIGQSGICTWMYLAYERCDLALTVEVQRATL